MIGIAIVMDTIDPADEVARTIWNNRTVTAHAVGPQSVMLTGPLADVAFVLQDTWGLTGTEVLELVQATAAATNAPNAR